MARCMPVQATNGSTRLRRGSALEAHAPEPAVQARQSSDAVRGLVDAHRPRHVPGVPASGGDVLHDEHEVERRLVDQ